MSHFRSLVEKIVFKANYLGIIACFSTVIVVSLNVIIRKISNGNITIPGTNELSAYCLVVICMLAIPALYAKHGHIRVDLFTSVMSDHSKNIFKAVCGFLELCVCVLLVSGSFIKVKMFYDIGTKMDITGIPKWPVAFICFFGFTELMLLILIDTVEAIKDLKR